MRTVTYGRPASKAKVVQVLKCHADGCVTVSKPAERPAETVRCVGCAHFQRDPSVTYMGYNRYSCALGHLRTDRDSLRWFTETEVYKPSTQLATISRNCEDHTASLGDLL